MGNRPATGELWQFNSFDKFPIYFLIGDIIERSEMYPERVTLILIGDTSPDNRWRRCSVLYDSAEIISTSQCWRRVA